MTAAFIALLVAFMILLIVNRAQADIIEELQEAIEELMKGDSIDGN